MAEDTLERRKKGLLFAVVSSVVVAGLFAAGALEYWLTGEYLSPAPVPTSLTLIAIASGAVPSLAWLVYLWRRTKLKGLVDLAFRVIMSCVLLLAFVFCFSSAVVFLFCAG